MSYWKGDHWVEEEPTPLPHPQSRSANWLATLLMALGLAALIAPVSFIAAASHQASSSGCSVDPASADVGETYVVSAWGISTGTAVNLWITENGVTTGYPLGSTPDGTFHLSMSSSLAGVTTYVFSGPTRKHMTIWGSCSVSAY